MSYTDRRSAPDGFGPHYVPWDYRPTPTKATPCPEPDASPIVPTRHHRSPRGELDWRFTRGECVALRAIPIERTPGGSPPDTAEDEILRRGVVDRVLADMKAAPPRIVCVTLHADLEPKELRRCPSKACEKFEAHGWFLVWALRAWHGTGSGDRGADRAAYRVPPAEGAAVSFLAMLTGALTEADEMRVIAAKRHHREAVEAAKAAKKAAGSPRARKIEKGIAKRVEVESARLLSIVYATPRARELAAARDAWFAKTERQRIGAMARVHAAALAAYREAGG